MANEPAPASNASPYVQAAQVYLMAVVCLVLGLAIGYLLLGSQLPASPAQVASKAAVALPAGHPAAGHMPTMQQMNQAADKQAAPLLEKLKSDPDNSALLSQVAAIYHSMHQFKDAAAYFDKAVQADPKNVALRTRFAASLYRSGDVDGAIAQLNRALKDDPHDANSLYNLGMIRLQGKGDGKGALAAWQQLLKSNPQLSADRKAEVLKRMADVQTMLADQHGIDKRSTER